MPKQVGDAGVATVDQDPVRGSRRNNPATYIGLLDQLVNSGKSVVVIEHHQAVMAHADWIIDRALAQAATVAAWSSRAPQPSW
jgi:excinuclease UvrABC ATPase subunit